MTRLLIGLALAFTSLDTLAEDVRRFYGYAFDLKTEEYLYTEVHQHVLVEGRWLRGSIRYFWPDGELIGNKTLDFSKNPYVPLYKLEIAGSGYVESITAITDDQITLRKQTPDGVKQKSVTHKKPMAADSGFHNLIVAEMDRLLKGETVPFMFAVAGNQDSYSFRVRKVADLEYEGRKAVRFKVEANSMLRFVAPDLDIVYDPARLELLDYRGVSNIPDPETGKVYNARIIYPTQPPQGAPASLPPLE